MKQIAAWFLSLFTRNPNLKCRKCGHDLRFGWKEVRYAKDPQYGERLLATCRKCGFKWGEPVRNPDK